MNNKEWRTQGIIILFYFGILMCVSAITQFNTFAILFGMMFSITAIALRLNTEKNKIIDYLESKE